VDTDAVKKSGEYLPIFLTRQVPVFVEYYTVRVDDNGRANFLADIYDLDDNPHLPEPPQKAVDL
jgi:murein L,D-transpeptidase YcbB/YkuD